MNIRLTRKSSFIGKEGVGILYFNGRYLTEDNIYAHCIVRLRETPIGSGDYMPVGIYEPEGFSLMENNKPILCDRVFSLEFDGEQLPYPAVRVIETGEDFLLARTTFSEYWICHRYFPTTNDKYILHRRHIDAYDLSNVVRSLVAADRDKYTADAVTVIFKDFTQNRFSLPVTETWHSVIQDVFKYMDSDIIHEVIIQKHSNTDAEKTASISVRKIITTKYQVDEMRKEWREE